MTKLIPLCSIIILLLTACGSAELTREEKTDLYFQEQHFCYERIEAEMLREGYSEPVTSTMLGDCLTGRYWLVERELRRRGTEVLSVRKLRDLCSSGGTEAKEANKAKEAKEASEPKSLTAQTRLEILRLAEGAARTKKNSGQTKPASVSKPLTKELTK